MGYKSFEYFIASKLSERKTNSFIAKIIRIAQIVIGLCLAVMLVGSAIISGFKHDITEKVFGFWGHIHILDAGTHLHQDQIPITKNQSFYKELEDIQQIEFDDYRYDPPKRVQTKGGIKKIQSFALLPGILENKTTMEGLIFKGIDQDYDWSFIQAYITEGTGFVVGDTIVSRSILISEQTARRMELVLGDLIIVHFIVGGKAYKRRFKISGIYKTGLEEYDKKYALIDIGVIRELLHWEADEVGGFEVIIEHLDDLELLNEYLYAEQLPSQLYSETLKQKAPQIFEWIDMQNINEVVLLFLMAVVALINMVTAMLIIILERTRMIGTLKALGARNWSIRKIFMIKAVRIASISLLIGNVIALGICLGQKYTKIIKLNEADYYISYVPIRIDIPWWITVNAATLGVIFLFMLLPSYLVSKIDPVKALRFK